MLWSTGGQGRLFEKVAIKQNLVGGERGGPGDLSGTCRRASKGPEVGPRPACLWNSEEARRQKATQRGRTGGMGPCGLALEGAATKECPRQGGEERTPRAVGSLPQRRGDGSFSGTLPSPRQGKWASTHLRSRGAAWREDKAPGEAPGPGQSSLRRDAVLVMNPLRAGEDVGDTRGTVLVASTPAHQSPSSHGPG